MAVAVIVVIIGVAVVIVMALIIAVIMVTVAIMAPGKGFGKNPEKLSPREKGKYFSGLLMRDRVRMRVISTPINTSRA